MSEKIKPIKGNKANNTKNFIHECDSVDMKICESKSTIKKQIYLPGYKLSKEEELVVDESAYRILHQAQTGAPCLSFDIINDNLGSYREEYPLALYLLAGTQAPRAHLNNLLVIKMSNLYGTHTMEDSNDEWSDTDNEDEKKSPVMNVALVKHQGCVNRVRCTLIENITIAASWSELGRIMLWNLSEPLSALNNSDLLSVPSKNCEHYKSTIKPIFTFKGHLSEGFGLDWCSTDTGTLASGDCRGNIYIWKCSDFRISHSWHVKQRPYCYHTPCSVEDLQWSPNEKHVLASCSTDKSIKIWDTRRDPQSSCVLAVANAHSSDVNVISWNKSETSFLLSGGDDGAIKVWDLRQFKTNGSSPVATFKQHTSPITTIEWCPQETTVFASGGADDQITQFDLSVESDILEQHDDASLAKLPPQLLFIHQGQNDVKELHWHPQCPGLIVSTALSGFNVFRSISI